MFVRGARELLVETRRTDGVPEYRLHHDSIRAHVGAAVGATALRGHHSALARKLATWPPPMDATARRYALQHALLHRAEAGAWVDAWRLAADMGFLEAKCRELGAHEAEADVARAAERCRASGDEALRGRFDDTASEGHTACVWDVVSGKKLSPPFQQQEYVISGALGFDGSPVIIATWNDTQVKWDRPLAFGTLADWRVVAKGASPYVLVNGRLTLRSGDEEQSASNAPAP